VLEINLLHFSDTIQLGIKADDDYTTLRNIDRATTFAKTMEIRAER
jgi:hypothetical protein